MMNPFLSDMIRTSVTAPRVAARRVIDFGLSIQVLLMLFALTVVANSLLFFLSMALSPPEENLPVMFANPLVYASVMGTGALALVLVLTRIGAMMGGTGTITDVLAVTVWLQCLRVAAQAVIVLLMIVSGALATILTLAVSILGLWLFISFLQEAHRFSGPLRAVVTSGLAVLALSFGLALLLTLTGVSPPQPI